jgi:hypothetical protein
LSHHQSAEPGTSVIQSLKGDAVAVYAAVFGGLRSLLLQLVKLIRTVLAAAARSQEEGDESDDSHIDLLWLNN